MIVNIRGTHGSGKSTLVRHVMSRFADKQPIHIPGRTKPIGYLLRRSGDFTPIHVVGHYETACGGCDSISKVEDAYRHVREAANYGHHVLFEGILAQHSTGRLLELHNEFRDALSVIVLDVEPNVAVASVQARRAERGDTRPLKPDNIFKEHRSTLSAAKRLRAAGVNLRMMSRDAALEETLRLVGVREFYSDTVNA